MTFEEETCPVCGRGMKWVECDMCGEGLIDDMTDDEYDTYCEETTACHHCDGHEGWLECSALPHSNQQIDEYRGRTEK